MTKDLRITEKQKTSQLASLVPKEALKLPEFRREIAEELNIASDPALESLSILERCHSQSLGIISQLQERSGLENGTKEPPNQWQIPKQLISQVAATLEEIFKDLTVPNHACYQLSTIQRCWTTLKGIENFTESININEVSLEIKTLLEDSYKGLKKIVEILSAAKALSDLPRLSADGIARANIYYLDPESLKNLREQRSFHPTRCELLIIGGGPAGLAATYHAGRAGIDTVLVDAHYFASSMSDARALPVHLMRTNSGGSSIFRSNIVPSEVASKLDMSEFMDQNPLRELAFNARSQASQYEGRSFPDWLPTNEDTHHDSDPVTRGEVFGYFSEIALLTSKFPSVFMSEQTEMNRITWDQKEERFTVHSTVGHELSAKYILIATGVVGVQAEASRKIDVIDQLCTLNPERYLMLQKESDLLTWRNKREFINSKGEGKQLILPDSFIGHLEIREVIQNLIPQTTLAVIGSGESAAKAVLALLELNPRLKINLFTKAQLEPHQGQAPPFGGIEDTASRAIRDPGFAHLTKEIHLRHFGTPITPESMHLLLNHVEAGNVIVFELGSKFGLDSVSLSSIEHQGKQATKISIASDRPDIIRNLKQQAKEWKKAGFKRNIALGSAKHLAIIDGPIIMAAGYDISKLYSNQSLVNQLHEQGQIEVDPPENGGAPTLRLSDSNHLFSATNNQISFSGAVMQRSTQDGVFGGMGVRSYRIIQTISEKLGKPVQKMEEENTFLSASVDKIVEPDPSIHRVRKNNQYSSRDRFPGNAHLQWLAERENSGDELSAVEKIILSRGDRLFERMRRVLRANEVSPLDILSDYLVVNITRPISSP